MTYIMFWEIVYNHGMTKKMQSQKHDEPDWVEVFTTPMLQEAHIIAGRLQSEDIAVYIHQQPGASAMGITLGTFGAIAVLVRPTDYDLAMELLYPDEPDMLTNPTDDETIIWGDDDDEYDTDSD